MQQQIYMQQFASILFDLCVQPTKYIELGELAYLIIGSINASF